MRCTPNANKTQRNFKHSEQDIPKRRIVSSRHLADGDSWESSEIEYGMIIAYSAFSRWMTRCMSAAGNTDLTPLEILVLHNCIAKLSTATTPNQNYETICGGTGAGLAGLVNSQAATGSCASCGSMNQ